MSKKPICNNEKGAVSKKKHKYCSPLPLNLRYLDFKIHIYSKLEGQPIQGLPG